MWTMTFWRRAVENMVRAAAWTLIAALGVPSTGEVVGLDVMHVGWLDALSLAAGAALLSLLGSLASSRVGDPQSPSVLR